MRATRQLGYIRGIVNLNLNYRTTGELHAQDEQLELSASELMRGMDLIPTAAAAAAECSICGSWFSWSSWLSIALMLVAGRASARSRGLPLSPSLSMQSTRELGRELCSAEGGRDAELSGSDSASSSTRNSADSAEFERLRRFCKSFSVSVSASSALAGSSRICIGTAVECRSSPALLRRRALCS